MNRSTKRLFDLNRYRPQIKLRTEIDHIHNSKTKKLPRRELFQGHIFRNYPVGSAADSTERGRGVLSFDKVFSDGLKLRAVFDEYFLRPFVGFFNEISDLFINLYGDII